MIIVSTYIPNKKEVKKMYSNNDVYLNTIRSDNRFNQNSTSDHKKNYSLAESSLNTIDFVNYRDRTQKIINPYLKAKKY